MQVRFVDQPARHLLGDELVTLLRSPETWRFWAASAWVRRPALRRLEPALSAFRDRTKKADCRGLFGVDLGGTTREGLELAGQLFGQARVFHSSGRPVRTFHPKLYLFEQPDRAILFVGSSNLTTGGLWGNFETVTILELDPGVSADEAVLKDAQGWYQQWWSDKNGTRPVGAKTIAALEADPAIRLPREREVRKLFWSGRRDRTAGASAFPQPVQGLKSIPKAPAGVDEAAERDEQPTEVVTGLLREEIETISEEDDLRVLLAGIPRDRWKQVGFNRDVTEDFFRVYVNGDAIWIQGVRQNGEHEPPTQGRLIFPSSNQNHRIEFPEPDGRGDPRPDRALLVVLESSFRTFRYMSLRPGDAGYDAVQDQLTRRPPFGVARKSDTKRVLTTYGELKHVWPDCPLA
jgi:PLD-like domain